ncbi:phage replisome organizer N-terminal domain-containing protein [Bacillus wiedmannii]|uniref:phage replisome organizer N-terminal domain-containing protein n=1 Tax=Bacillus wiedmannii TaxID=1890302 RepID=UPI0015D4B53B|nr:phage replisome organizer N-terminal domain-containing protein [Bacillus wiedmannii]
MTEVKWIKLSTSMFEDEKIRLIESMPDADTLLIIWFKLLSQAGKTNASGYIFLSENIPYTEEMLSTLFNRPLATIRLALQTFQQFGMIQVNEERMIHIANWEKHQNIDGLEKIREQNRLRKQKQREREQQVLLEMSRDSHVPVTDGHAIDIEEDIEEDKEEDKELNNIVEIVDHLNRVCKTKYRSTSQKTRTLIKARLKEKFTVEDFKKVIDIKNEEWEGTTQAKYLRPETLFGTKFEGYLNQESIKGAMGNGKVGGHNEGFNEASGSYAQKGTRRGIQPTSGRGFAQTIG